MSTDLRNLTNDFQSVRLVSLASWKAAGEFQGRDRGGPYIVTQEGYDPEDLRMTADEFVLGRSGKWLSLSFFFHLPIAERRAEYVFSNAGEVMEVMHKLPPKAVMLRPEADAARGPATPETDEMAVAYQAGRGQTPKPNP